MGTTSDGGQVLACCPMIIVSWNIRGLGRPEKRMAVKKLVRRHRVDLLILQETKIDTNIDCVVHDV